MIRPVPKPTFKKRERNDVPPEQYEHVKRRANGCCECCGKPLVYTEAIRPDKAELHHIFPKGQGGTTHKYENWELMMLRLECHDKEEDAGYPHRRSWVEMVRQKYSTTGGYREVR